MKKRVISILITLCMFFAMTASTVFASPNTHANTYRNTGNQRTDIVGVAKTQLGYTEGRNNDTKYGDWYGLPNQPWCAMFVSWCARQAGIPTSVLKNSSCAGASSRYFNISYYDGKNYKPKAGDLFFTKSWSHVGLVERVEGNYFYTIEGNSNSNGSSEGTCVCSNKRYIPNFYFGVPNYKTTTTSITSFNTNFYLTAANYCYGYPSVNASSNFGRIFPNDRVQITKIYSNGWAEGKCPWGGPIKTIYFKVNELKFKCTKYINAYSNANGTTSAGGRAFPGDVCTLKSVNSRTLLCNCPWGRGYRDIYLKLSDMT